MKKLFLLPFTLFLSVIPHLAGRQFVTTGRNMLTGDSISSERYLLPGIATAYHLDTDSGTVVMRCNQFREKGDKIVLGNRGEIMLFDLFRFDKRWSMPVGNLQAMPVICEGSEMLVGKKGRTHLVDMSTGELSSPVNTTIRYMDPVYMIGFGPHRTKQRQLQGVNLRTGEVLWERKIEKDELIKDIKSLGDSTILLAGEGLRLINLYNGKGWDYKIRAHENDFGATIGINALGILLGMLTGVVTISYGYNVHRGLISNIVYNDADIFVSSFKAVICIGHDGELRWERQLRDNMTGHTKIFLRDDTLYVIGMGTGFTGRNDVIPFIAAYDAATGYEKSIDILGEKSLMVRGDMVTDDHVLFILDDRLSRFSFRDGRVVNTALLSDLGIAGRTGFVTESYYVRRGDRFGCITAEYPNHILIRDIRGCHVFGSSIVAEEIIGNEAIYQLLHENRRYRFFAGDSRIAVQDNHERVVAEIELDGNCLVLEDYLYVFSSRELYRTDISAFI